MTKIKRIKPKHDDTKKTKLTAELELNESTVSETLIASTEIPKACVVEASKRKLDHVDGRYAKRRKLPALTDCNMTAKLKSNECAFSETQSSSNAIETTATQIAPLESIELTSSNTQMMKIDFKVGEVVWAKIRGHPHWPAKIKSFSSSKMAIVVWFNDYRVTKIYRTQLFKFLNNFDSFAKNFDNTIGLKTAAQEALMFYGNTLNDI